MRFNKHSEIEGKHSFLSPSKGAWLRYDDEKLERMFVTHLAALRGTKEHAFAQQAIALGMKMPADKKTINQYINDCIGWKMTPEVPLLFSRLCYGHADALGFRDWEKILRISDYKSGRSKTSFDQLLIYAALFCLEYDKDPNEIGTELRIYQSRDVKLWTPTAEEVFFTMRTIIHANTVLERLDLESKS